MRYVSTAGHGGSDPGAIGNGLKEAEVVRIINKWFVADMRAAGFDTVDGTSDSGDANTVLNAQIRNANNSGAGFGVSWHLNANSGTPGTGTEVLYYPGSKEGYEAAEKVSKAISAKFGWANRGAKARADLGWLNYTSMPVILIECCFINNAGDVAKLKGKERLLADTVIEALTGKKVGVLEPDTQWHGKIIAGENRVQTGDEMRKWLVQLGYANKYEKVFIYNIMSDADGMQAFYGAVLSGGVPIGVWNDRNRLTEAVAELEAHRGEIVELYQVGGPGALLGEVMNRLKLAAGL